MSCLSLPFAAVGDSKLSQLVQKRPDGKKKKVFFKCVSVVLLPHL